MRDLHLKKPQHGVKNRLKRQKKPINYRGLFKKVARLAGGCIALSLICIVGYEVYGVVVSTTFLRLERIDVTPLKRLTREDVIVQTGVKPGDAMFRLRLRRIGEQLAKNPWVDKVKVRRLFPHTLAIEIVEREPVAVVNMGYLYYLDTRGEIFKPLTEGDLLDYPVLTGIEEEEMEKDPVGAKEALKTAVGLIDLLKRGTDFKLDDISEIHYDKGYGFTLFTAQRGVPIKLGNDGHAEKLSRLVRIYGELRAQLPGIEYIDLNYSDKIIVKKA
jgi:cell division septal protein FtsQ